MIPGRFLRRFTRIDALVEEPIYAFWSRSGGTKALEAASARVFDVEAMLE